MAYNKKIPDFIRVILRPDMAKDHIIIDNQWLEDEFRYRDVISYYKEVRFLFLKFYNPVYKRIRRTNNEMKRIKYHLEKQWANILMK